MRNGGRIMVKCLYKDFCPLVNTPECNNSCIRHKEINYLLEKSGIPEKRQFIQNFIIPKEDEVTYNKLTKVMRNIEKYVDNGDSFVLYSNGTGNGKTSWAIKIMLSYFDKIWAGNGFRTRGYFVYVPDLLNRAKANISKPDEEYQELMENIKDVDLLILDDIGTTSMSEFDISLLSSIIDQRCLKCKSTIYTTNCYEDKMESLVGTRLVDRIWHNSITFNFKGSSKRGII